MRSLAGGLVISWFVALVHWIHVDANLVSNPGWRFGAVCADDVSGIDVVADTARYLGVPGTRDWSARAYGWPVRNWCAVIRDTGQLRAAFRSSVPVFAIDCSALFTRTPNSDEYFGQMPLFPAWGESIANSLVWGAAVFGIAKVVSRRRRRELARLPCRACGYELWGCRDATNCPECGSTR